MLEQRQIAVVFGVVLGLVVICKEGGSIGDCIYSRCGLFGWWSWYSP